MHNRGLAYFLHILPYTTLLSSIMLNSAFCSEVPIYFRNLPYIRCIPIIERFSNGLFYLTIGFTSISN